MGVLSVVAKKVADGREARKALAAVASTAVVSQDAEAGFFSQAVKASQALQRKSGNAQSFWNDLTGKGQVKPDELNAMGFKEHFGNRNDISKEEVQQFINDNQISIDEVRLGGSLPDKPYFYLQNNSGFYDYFDGDGIKMGSRRTEEEAQAAVDEWNNSHRYSDDNSKYGKYTLDSGESGDNYRELLMRLENGGGYKSGHFDEDNILTHLRMKDRVDADGNKTLLLEEVQSDWHQSGKEFGYRNDARIQEIADSLEATDKRRKEIRSLLLPVRKMESDLSSKEIDDLISEYYDLGEKKLALEEEDFALSKTIPNAPFKGDDKSSWYNLAMKRGLIEAAEGDYDKLAFTTGRQQADRYNLRNFVSSLKYQEDIVDGRPVNILTAYDRDGHRVFNKGIKDPQTELPSIIGKEAAEKLLNADPYTPPQETRKIRQLRDQDLELGGEGMKQFYDRTLPNTLNKLVKQDGVKVGKTELQHRDAGTEVNLQGFNMYEVSEINRLQDLVERGRASEIDKEYLNNLLAKQKPRKGDIVHSIDITPEMRERVKKGLPLFTTAVGVPTVGALFSPDVRAESEARKNMTRRERRANPPSEALRNYATGRFNRSLGEVGIGVAQGAAETLDFMQPLNMATHLMGLPQVVTPYQDAIAPLTDIKLLEDEEARNNARLIGSLFSPI